jgi:DUF971 family protein
MPERIATAALRITTGSAEVTGVKFAQRRASGAKSRYGIENLDKHGFSGLFHDLLWIQLEGYANT